MSSETPQIQRDDEDKNLPLKSLISCKRQTQKSFILQAKRYLLRQQTREKERILAHRDLIFSHDGSTLEMLTIGTATKEVSMEAPQKVKSRTTV